MNILEALEKLTNGIENNRDLIIELTERIRLLEEDLVNFKIDVENRIPF